jgi:phospholipid transport system substrate-binding protein
MRPARRLANARALFLCLALALAPILPTQPGAAVADVPDAKKAAASQVISRLDEMLLDIMKRADELGYGGRYEIVAPVVRDVFDISFMARKTVGRHWTKFSDDDRRRWVETFEAFTISNFAERFDGFSGESFTIVGHKPASGETLIVLTRLNRPGTDDVSLNYRMREASAGWRVVDIYSGGRVSEIALRRSEYAKVLKDGGVNKLIASVSKMTAKRAGSVE